MYDRRDRILNQTELVVHFVKLYLTHPSPRMQLLAERCEDPGTYDLAAAVPPTIGLC